MAAQPVVRSAVPSAVWPAIPSPQHAVLLALQFQLERSQWLSPDELTKLQFIQAKELLKHVLATVPYYQQHLPPDLLAGDQDINWESWCKIPILRRADIQQFGDEMVSKAIPPSHLPIQPGLTSGSTGRPLHSMKTLTTGLMWHACSLRERLWHNYDTSAKLAVIRYSDDPAARSSKGVEMAGWGQSTDMLLPDGHTVMLDIRHSVQEQMQWLIHHQPDYLMSYPSNLAALAEAFIKNPATTLKNLRSVSTLGEILTPRHRELFRQAWNVEAYDVYSSEEAGFMAIQCPTGEHYHVQSEHVLMEVIDENGQSCKPGEIGRIVITTLNNFAKPLIRYEMDDYAEVGSACPCGRGLPVISKIMGRVRSMFVRPDGQVFWPVIPNLGEDVIAEMPAVRQYQYVQKALDWIEMRIVIEEPPYSDDLEAAIVKGIQKEYGYPFRVTFAYLKEIPRRGRDKYEEFINELAIETKG